MNFVTQPIVTALLVPLTFLLFGGVAKKLVRGSSWLLEDFYLGIEASLAAFSYGLEYLFELAKTAKTSPTISTIVDKLIFEGVFLVAAFGLLFVVMAEHQQWQPRPDSTAKKIRLLGVCNAVGCGLIFAFILVVKGV